MKNLVLLAAGIASAGRVRRARPGESIPQILAEPLSESRPRRAG